MSKNTLKKKNILVTGATGFVGTHLMRKLENLGANPYGISHTTKNNKIIKADILDFSKMSRIIKAKNITICFHLAGEALVETGQKSPYDTFKTNIEGTLNILENARIHNFERVIIASSSHVYGKNKVPYFEKYSPRPSRPYETSKTCTDLIAQSYADSFNLPVLIPRFVNIYGPGDLNINRLIPQTIKNILTGIHPTMWGGDAIRDYLYIDDAIEAYIALATVDIKKVGNNRVFNFGSNNMMSVRELIKRLIDIAGVDLKIKKIEEQRESEIKSQYVSSKKANRLLDWKPKTTLDKGLRHTVAWYREFLYNMPIKND